MDVRINLDEPIWNDMMSTRVMPVIDILTLAELQDSDRWIALSRKKVKQLNHALKAKRHNPLVPKDDPLGAPWRLSTQDAEPTLNELWVSFQDDPANARDDSAWVPFTRDTWARMEGRIKRAMVDGPWPADDEVRTADELFQSTMTGRRRIETMTGRGQIDALSLGHRTTWVHSGMPGFEETFGPLNRPSPYPRPNCKSFIINDVE